MSLPWMDTATSLRDTKEVPGSGNNPRIMAWASVIGGDIEKSYVADSIPWCGLYVAYCLVENGIRPVNGALWALSWRNYGKTLSEPCFGCVMTFKRQGGGHVGFYVSEDATHYHILGGNQTDAVNVTRVPKGQFVSANWPAHFMELRVPGRIIKKFDKSMSSVQKFD